MTDALRLEGVRVGFGSSRHRLMALDGVDLAVRSGTVVGLVGESGSGKSTLGRVAVGLRRPDEGRVLVGGRDVASLQRRDGGGSSSVQMIFQDPSSSLDPRMPVSALIAEGLRGVRGKAARRSEVDRLLSFVELSSRVRDDRIRHLSGGMRQRVAIARSLAARPAALVADEITAALDVSVQGTILNLLARVQRELGMSVLFISHNVAIVRYISDEIAVLRAGVIVERGTTEQVTTHPSHEYTRQLIAAVPDGLRRLAR